MLEIEKFNKIIIANWKLNGSLSFSNEYLIHLAENRFFQTSNSHGRIQLG